MAGRNAAMLVDVDHVTKVYRPAKRQEILAVADLTFDVRDGEFLAIVGPSGCGKSTLLKMLAGLLPISGGAIRIAGKPVNGPVSYLGMVFQAPLLLKWRSVLENVMLPVEVLGREKAEYYPKALELLNLVGLEQFASHYPSELSGGMQQRAAICRALIHDPPLLLMDEPFGALDAMTREEMGVELLRIWEQKRKSILFVTHSIEEAVFLADRVLVLSARPSRVASFPKIDLDRPRHFASRFDERFRKYTEEIREAIGLKPY